MTFKLEKLSFILIFTLLSHSRCSENLVEIKRDILDHILPKNPNEVLVAPGSDSNGTTDVQIFLHMKSIDSIDEERMELTTRFIIRQVWKDNRLRYNSDNGQISNLLIHDAKIIWTPDIYFSNLVKASSYDIFRPSIYIRIFPDGTVIYSKWVSLITSCPLNIKMFPFDYQTCDLLITTYGSTQEDVKLIWKETAPVTVSHNIFLRGFFWEKFMTHYRTFSTTSGIYTTLGVSFVFIRTLRYYLLHIYIPCTMFVVLSWMSFWINMKKITTRLLISLPALLTSTVIICGYNKSKPKVSYTTYMDWFTGICSTFLLFAVAESIIGYILLENSDNTKNLCIEKADLKDIQRNGKRFKKLLKIANKLDRWIRFMFPLAYVVFCVIYFSLGQIVENGNYPTIEGNHTTTWLDD